MPEFQELMTRTTPDLLQKLEEFKHAGNYAITLYYGEDIGTDDLDIPMMSRKISVFCCPVVYL